MTVRLTPKAEELLHKLAHWGSPEQIVEKALARLAAQEPALTKRMTPSEAVDRILELRERHTLGGLSINERIDEGRK